MTVVHVRRGDLNTQFETKTAPAEESVPREIMKPSVSKRAKPWNNKACRDLVLSLLCCEEIDAC